MEKSKPNIGKKILVIEPEICKEMHFDFHPTVSSIAEHTKTVDEQSFSKLYEDEYGPIDGGLVARALSLIEPPINDYKSGKQNRRERRAQQRKTKKRK